MHLQTFRRERDTRRRMPFLNNNKSYDLLRPTILSGTLMSSFRIPPPPPPRPPRPRPLAAAAAATLAATAAACAAAAAAAEDAPPPVQTQQN